MRRTKLVVLAAFAALTLLFVACTETKTNQAGLALIIATNLATPADLDAIVLEVRQESEPGKYETLHLANEFRIPDEAQLPATFTIGPGASARQNAYIRLTGRRAGKAIVLREVKIQIPKNRIAALNLVLAASCVNHLQVDDANAARTDCANPEESCQPDSGLCGPTLIDVNTLPDFDPTKQLEEARAIPLVKLDAGGGGERPDDSDAGTLDAGPPKSTAKEITELRLEGTLGTIVGDVITVLLPPSANLTSLAPEISITGASVSPPSLTPQDFTGPVRYRVTAADGTVREYVVVVQLTGLSAKKITSFELPQGSTLIDQLNIKITVPIGTNITLIAPTIAFEGKSVTPHSGTPQNFTNPFPYKVTAYDGSTQSYLVTVVFAAASDKDITELSIQGVKGTIAGTNINVQVPGGTDLAAVQPKVVITGKSVSPASLQTVNLSSPIPYTVTAADGSTKVYTVSASALPKSSKDITSFTIQAVPATIVGTSVSLVLPAGTNLASLVPAIGHSGASVSPPSGAAQDFTSPRQYVVTAEDGSTQTYTVTVTAAPGSNAKDITDFVVNGVHAIFAASSGTVTLVSPSSLAALAPVITVSPDATVSPPSGSPRDFSAGAVVYTVTAQNGSQKQYSMTVTQPLAAAPAFTPASPVTQDTPFDVDITSTTPGAVIHYTTDGSLPTEASPTTLPVHIATANVTIKAVTIATGYQRAHSSPGLYSVAVGPVAFAPASGQPHNGITLNLTTATLGAAICYTSDGSAPACTLAGGCAAGTAYAGPLVAVNSPGHGVTLSYRAIGCKTGLADSLLSTATYLWTVANPIYDRAPGHYVHGTVVNVTTATVNEDALPPVSLYYTNDGSDPVCGSHGFVVPGSTYAYTLTATEGNILLKTRGCRADYLESSVVVVNYQVP